MLESVASSECLVGWRGWNIYHPHFLVSGNLVYEPRKRHEAKCGVDHLAPDPGCTCGIYSFKTLEELKKQNYNNQKILGEVWLWGRVVEHASGYRSQYSYPKKFYFPRENKPEFASSAFNVDSAALAPYVSFLYGVPYEILEPGHEILQKVVTPRTFGARPRPVPGLHTDPGSRRNVYYSVTPTGMKAGALMALPPQAVRLVHIMAKLMKDDDPVPEKKFVDAVMVAAKLGELKTIQHPWHIFAGQVVARWFHFNNEGQGIRGMKKRLRRRGAIGEMLLKLGWEPPKHALDVWRPPAGTLLRHNWERWTPVSKEEYECSMMDAPRSHSTSSSSSSFFLGLKSSCRAAPSYT